MFTQYFVNSAPQKGHKSGILLKRRRFGKTAGYYQRDFSLNNLFISKVNSVKLFLKLN